MKESTDDVRKKQQVADAKYKLEQEQRDTLSLRGNFATILLSRLDESPDTETTVKELNDGDASQIWKQSDLIPIFGDWERKRTTLELAQILANTRETANPQVL